MNEAYNINTTVYLVNTACKVSTICMLTRKDENNVNVNIISRNFLRTGFVTLASTGVV